MTFEITNTYSKGQLELPFIEDLYKTVECQWKDLDMIMHNISFVSSVCLPSYIIWNVKQLDAQGLCVELKLGPYLSPFCTVIVYKVYNLALVTYKYDTSLYVKAFTRSKKLKECDICEVVQTQFYLEHLRHASATERHMEIVQKLSDQFNRENNFNRTLDYSPNSKQFRVAEFELILSFVKYLGIRKKEKTILKLWNNLKNVHASRFLLMYTDAVMPFDYFAGVPTYQKRLHARLDYFYSVIKTEDLNEINIRMTEKIFFIVKSD